MGLDLGGLGFGGLWVKKDQLRRITRFGFRLTYNRCDVSAGRSHLRDTQAAGSDG